MHDIGTPICVGPKDIGNIAIFLPDKEKRHLINITLYYWDVNHCSYSSNLELDVCYIKKLDELWFVKNEYYKHSTGLQRPTEVQNQRGL